jgi:hypothetical protein
VIHISWYALELEHDIYDVLGNENYGVCEVGSSVVSIYLEA